MNAEIEYLIEDLIREVTRAARTEHVVDGIYKYAETNAELERRDHRVRDTKRRLVETIQHEVDS